MKFGTVPLDRAEGAILAHSVRTTNGAVKKGTVLRPADIERLAACNIESVMVAQPGEGDIGEDAVAGRIAGAIAGPGMRVAEAFTGRANLFAEKDGLFTLNSDALNRLNAVDESITIATLPPFARVCEGQMVATVKVIPFAVDGKVVERTERQAAEQPACLCVHYFQPLRVQLVLTRFAHDKPSVLEKRERAVSERVQSLGGKVTSVDFCAHDSEALSACLRDLTPEGGDLVMVFGTSAILDRRDVIPAALEQAGGSVEYLGMPVDPGNLLMLGRLGDLPAIGVPSCASAPKVNGFDWVLERIFADLPLDGDVISGMGVGGLLGEIATRPQPRRKKKTVAQVGKAGRGVAAIILAAGQSTRMGPRFKLTEPLAGKAIVRHCVEAALAARAYPVVVVTGYRSEDVRAALADLDIMIVDNPDYSEGLSSSLRVGVEALGAECEGALIMLGDMPNVTTPSLERLIAAFKPDEGAAICVPTLDGKRGNPVLWGAAFFPQLRSIHGDTGARHLIGELAEQVREVEIEDRGIFVDVDTQEALAQIRKSFD